MTQTIAMIPARGGSKRIPRKNIKAFRGRPIIAYAIEAAHKAGCFDAVIVSTDDAEIAEIAQAHGAETPFVRPASLADDHATTQAVIRHTVDWYDAAGHALDLICCLYPAAALVQASDIRDGKAILEQQGADYCFTVTPFPSAIQRALRITPDAQLASFNPAYSDMRSQDLEAAYFDAGQFYWCRAEAIRTDKPLRDSHTLPLLVPGWRVQDIDTPEDWERAELVYDLLQRRLHEQA